MAQWQRHGRQAVRKRKKIGVSCTMRFDFGLFPCALGRGKRRGHGAGGGCGLVALPGPLVPEVGELKAGLSSAGGRSRAQEALHGTSESMQHHVLQISPAVGSASGAGDGVFQEALNYFFFIIQLQKKTLPCPLYSFSPTMPENESGQPRAQY